MAFDQATRNRLQKFVGDARKLLSDEFTRQLQNIYGLDPITGGVAELSNLPALSPSEQQTAQLLRDTLEHYLATSHKADPHKDKVLVTAALDRIVREQAFTVLNRLAALRMAEARQFIMESISQGYQSKGFQLYQRIASSSLGETGQAYQHYLFSVFDELSLDLAVLFDRYSSQGRLFPRETVLLELLDLINHAELEVLWGEDETVGWIYQYFNSKEERKKMRDESQAPRNSRELAVRNQFFTPRYVVEFLTDNTLGRIWYEMTQGKTALVDSCQYLVQRPNEIFLKSGEVSPEHTEQDSTELSQAELLQQPVYIQHRPIKDPRDIKMLDPACGSMHFGLYAFDLFEQIYSEAWDIEEEKGREAFWYEEGCLPKEALHGSYPDKEGFIADVPRLIIEHNIHGVDIDPRAAQIAGLSLWLRAQKTWSSDDVKPVDRPQIQRSNIVCAEPMPGEKEILKEFTSQVQPRVLGQLVEDIFDKMQLAGEAGTLLKIEEEIQSAIDEAKSQKDESVLEVQGGLFGGDKWEVREGKRYYDFGDVGEEFWEQAEKLILSQLEIYAESEAGLGFGQKRLFAADTTRGFAFIDLSRNKFDVVLMNPPFGEGAMNGKTYFSKTYQDWSKNILCAFLSRAKSMLIDGGLYGSIFDRTVVMKSSYEDFRKNQIIDGVEVVADTGWGVLDANVETTAYTFRKKPDSVNTSIFFDLRDVEINEKSVKLLDSLDFSKCDSSVYVCKNSVFKSLPNSVIGYDFDEISKALFSSNPSLQVSGFQARKGHDYSSFQHFRLFWERDINDCIPSGGFVRVYNGSSYSSFLSPLRDIVLYGNEASLVKEHKSVYIRNSKFHFKPGIGYGKRGDILDAHYLPAGFSFTSEGLAITNINGSDSKFLLGYLNSSLGQYLLNTYSGQHKAVGYVNLLPCLSLSREVRELVVDNVTRLIAEKYKWLTYDETSPFFSPKTAISKFISISADSLVSEMEFSSSVYNKLLDVNDECFERVIGEAIPEGVSITKSQRPNDYPWFDDLGVLEFEKVNKFLIKYKLSLIFSLLWQRWQSEDCNSFDENLGFSEVEDNLSKFFSVCTGGGPSIVCFDVAGEKDFCKEIKAILQKIVPGSVDEYVNTLLVENEVGSIRELFSAENLFHFHLNQYSKSRREAPVYWPIQSSEGSLTIWVYFHRLDDQILYSCVNDYVNPELERLSAELDLVKVGVSRNSHDEKKMTKYLSLQAELQNFKDDLLNLAPIWKPNLNDGVLISAAPLWNLFGNAAWKSSLKGIWTKLEKGELDWSGLALTLWPERVLVKCHEDRSIAIAHDVESELWEEREVPVGKTKKMKLAWVQKVMSEEELATYIKNKIAQG